MGKNLKVLQRNMMTTDTSVKSYEALKANWPEIKVVFKMRLFKVGKFDTFFQQAIKKLDHSLEREEYDERTLLILYRIIDLETKRVMLSQELKDCLPHKLLDIQNKAQFVLEANKNYFDEALFDIDEVINFNMWFW